MTIGSYDVSSRDGIVWDRWERGEASYGVGNVEVFRGEFFAKNLVDDVDILIVESTIHRIKER